MAVDLFVDFVDSRRGNLVGMREGGSLMRHVSMKII